MFFKQHQFIKKKKKKTHILRDILLQAGVFTICYISVKNHKIILSEAMLIILVTFVEVWMLEKMSKFHQPTTVKSFLFASEMNNNNRVKFEKKKFKW